MRRIIYGALAALAITTASAEDLSRQAATDTTTGIKAVDTIAGTSLKFIQLALPEFKFRGLNLDEYRIIVVLRDNGRHVVILRYLSASPGLEIRARSRVWRWSSKET